MRGGRGTHQVAVQTQPYRQSSEKLEVLGMDKLVKGSQLNLWRRTVAHSVAGMSDSTNW